MTKNETKTLPTFTLLSEYHTETEQQYTKRQEYAARVSEQEQLVKALDYRYKDVIAKAVESGEDNTATLAKINKDRAAARQELENRKQMYDIVRTVQKRKITTTDLDREFNKFKAEYQTDVVNPSEKALRVAKEQYIAAYLEHEKKIEYFKVQAEEVAKTVKPNNFGVPYSVGFITADNRNRKTITVNDLDDLAKGKQPDSLKPPMVATKNAKGHIVYVPVEEE